LRESYKSKAVTSESSKPIQAIIVTKQDANMDEQQSKGENVQGSKEGSEERERISNESTTGSCDNWLYDSVPDCWKECLLPCRDKLLELSSFLATKEFLPPREDIWRALVLTPPESIKVVILGQDPYPTRGNAHGLAFSVLPDIRPIPASLKNIYKELVTDIGFVPPNHGNLEGWAKQGVMLLNTVLTVEAGSPQSHSKIGWEEVTDQIIRSIAAKSKNVVFVLWGKSAQAKKKILGMYLDMNKHRVFESAHPSPLSASKGFFGTKPFSRINEWLIEDGKDQVNWQIY
jgi:uracil-DNA glycosylase